MNLTLRPNCSTYNPCGQRGNCIDKYGQWTCDCILWWNGTTCDSLTNSGKQVIILGVVTFCLIVIYYALSLRHWLKRRQNQVVIRMNTPNRRAYTRMLSKPFAFRSFLPWLIALGTLILGVIGVSIKYSILKNIHNEIVDKYQRNQSIFYTRPQICSTMYPNPDFNVFTFPFACFLIFLFILTTKRQHSTVCNNFCSGYIAIPIPLDFFSHVKRTFAAAIFAIIADDLMNIALELLNGTASTSLGEGIILTYLSQILKVIFIGVRCYPILAAVQLDTRLSLICAILYTWFDFFITIGFRSICRNSYYATDANVNTSDSEATKFYLAYYGTGSYLIFIQLLTDFPRYLFISYICIQLPILLYKRIREDQQMIKPITREQKYLLFSSKINSFESNYVANLFGINENTSSMNRFVRLIRYVYTWRNDFRYSSRIICVYVSIFFLLFFLNMQACVQIPPYIGEIDGSLQPVHHKFQLTKSVLFAFQMPNLVRPFYIALFISLLIIIIQLFVLLSTIRRNLLQVFRGDHTEIPRRQQADYVSYANANIHFAGYLIGYVLWGYVLITVFIALITFFFTFVGTFGWVGFIASISKLIIPPILFGLFQNYLNKILGQFVFLQQGGQVFSLKNRRLLMLFLYFNFYLDAFLGLISSIIRILKSVVGGMIYMCRLDYSVMGRKLESYDAGFNAYCGFIHMESAHRHPILLYFSSLLIREQLYGTSGTRRSKAVQRWHLAAFLLRNPTLIYRRKTTIRGTNDDSQVRLSLVGRRMISSFEIEE